MIYRCADLAEGMPAMTAAVAGGSYIGGDARPDPAGELDGMVVALCEHAPRWDVRGTAGARMFSC